MGESMKGRRKTQGNKQEKAAALLLEERLCGRLAGLLSPSSSASGGTPRVGSGVRNFLEILELRRECG